MDNTIKSLFVLLTIVGLLLVGCAPYPVAPAKPWKPSTTIPKLPAFCPTSWQDGDTNIDHPGYHLNGDQRDSCDRWALRIEFARMLQQLEINRHEIDVKYGHPGPGGILGPGHTTYYYGPSGGFLGGSVSY